MKKLAIVLCFACALTLTMSAAEGKKEHKTERKALKKELAEKYDADKDGKLDKTEKAKISAEDREKMDKAGLGEKKKKQGKENK